ncbi:MAG: FHA domain-containing serine/threonine-protein kinase [Planctomycetota bacterium]
MNEAGIALELPRGTRTADGRTLLVVDGASPLRLGSDAAWANAVVPQLDPTHATIAPIKGGGVGMRIEDGADGSVNGTPARTVRLNVGDVVRLGGVELRVVERATQEAPAPKEAPTSLARRVPLPSIPGYRVEKQLGRGAMGRVYLAVQEKLDRRVALKLLDPDRCRDAKFVEEFENEARAAAALHHNNVVTVFDFGEHDGQHFLVLEYMDRGSLEDRLVKEGPLPWRAVLGVMRDAAAGLEFAESKGIVHRDIKPANLMQNASGVTKIVDLGLATQADSDAEGKVHGTAHFIAPEQARGGPVDSRADLYSLGASAWRLLTARTPFTGASAREILRGVLNEPAPSLASEVEGLPSEVDRLVLDLMAKEPDARPRTAREVRERVEALIQRFSGGAAIDAAPGATASRGPLVAILVVAVLALGGVGAWLGGLFGGDAPRDVDGDGRSARALPDTPEDDGGTEERNTTPNPPNTTGGPGARTETPAIDQDAALKELERLALSSSTGRRDRRPRAQEGAPAPHRRGVRRHGGGDRGRDATRGARARDERRSGDSTLDLESVRATELATRPRARSDGAGDWLPPQYALRALLDAPLPTALAGDETFAEMLAAKRAEAESAFLARVDAERAAARAKVEAGAFDAARTGYDALVAWLTDAPAPPTQEAALDPSVQAPPPPKTYLAETVASVKDERDTLPALARRFESAMAHADMLARRRELHRSSDVFDAFATLDLARANAVLAGLGDETRSKAGADWVAGVRDWVGDGAGFAKFLETTFRADEWRRRSIALPGPKRDLREVVTIDSRGFVLGTDGSSDIVPLSAFGGASDLVEALVNERLVRDTTAAERDTIAAALVATATVQSVRAAPDAIAGRAVTAETAAALRDAVARARAWCDPDDTALLEELRAAELAASLVGALAASDLGQAAWASDALVERHGDTLLVGFLSDGSAVPEPPAWPPQW